MPLSEEEKPKFEEYPLTRGEYITVMTHFYRSEVSRSNTWRQRRDTTSNWAVISAMGLLSFAFGTSSPQSQGTVILGMLVVFHFLHLEARRYRFFDVWRNRTRMIEENFIGPVITRELHSPEKNWNALVAGDLLEPRFKISLLQAIRARFIRNYITLFGILLGAWILKIAKNSNNLSLLERMRADSLLGALEVIMVVGMYGFLIWVYFWIPPVKPPELSYWSVSTPIKEETRSL